MIALLDNIPLHLVQLTVDQYHRMLEVGVLKEGAPIELIDGLLVYKDRRDRADVPVTNQPHVYVNFGDFDLPLVALNVDQYHTLIRTGVLAEGAPIELIDGLLMWKDRSAGGEDFMTVSPEHSNTIDLLAEQLRSLIDRRKFHVRCQQPVNVGPEGEPEPDLAVIMGPVGTYAKHHPKPKEVELVIEIADSSLAHDRQQKQTLYATSGIPRYWIVNLRNQSIEVYSEPQTDMSCYESLDVFRHGDTVEFELAGQAFALDVSTVLPTPDPANDN